MLTPREIEFVTRKWISVAGGYLGDFTYQSHYDFYSDYCGLEHIDPYQYQGTTRERFARILLEAVPRVQAKILRGVLAKYPFGSAEQRTQAAHERMLELITRCEGGTPVAPVNPKITSEVVELALADAETLLASSPVSAVDRIHTAFHGYLKALCSEKGVAFGKDDGIARLFKLLWNGCEQLKPQGAFAEQIRKVVQSFGSAIDAINTVRNLGSLAHPNEQLIDASDAMLCINAVRSLLHYLDSKTRDA